MIIFNTKGPIIFTQHLSTFVQGSRSNAIARHEHFPNLIVDVFIGADEKRIGEKLED